MSKWTSLRTPRWVFLVLPRIGFSRSDSCTPTLQVTKKPKKEKKEEQGEIVVPVEELSPIAHPLAQKRLLKKLNKAVKKGVFRCHLVK